MNREQDFYRRQNMSNYSFLASRETYTTFSFWGEIRVDFLDYQNGPNFIFQSPDKNNENNVNSYCSCSYTVKLIFSETTIKWYYGIIK